MFPFPSEFTDIHFNSINIYFFFNNSFSIPLNDTLGLYVLVSIKLFFIIKNNKFRAESSTLKTKFSHWIWGNLSFCKLSSWNTSFIIFFLDSHSNKECFKLSFNFKLQNTQISSFVIFRVFIFPGNVLCYE